MKDKGILYFTVLVAALGYFVDIYDIIIFSMVRLPSLREIGVSQDQLLPVGLSLLSTQMWGMLLGGVIWGILGDKKGRLSVLFISILFYSIANIANGFVQTVPQYYILRFISGIGLAGELGAGITLVSEILPKEQRGYGTTFVATLGILGAVAAYWVSHWWSWRNAYFVGGGMGILLLIFRIAVYESTFFKQAVKQKVSRGNFLRIFIHKESALKYLKCILIALPVWYIVGVLVTGSYEFAKMFGMDIEHFDLGKAIMLNYIGISAGDLISGVLSQWLKSRKKALMIFHLFSCVTLILFLLTNRLTSVQEYYFIIFLLGIGVGYWAVFITVAAEQFGTNIRATVATTVPNFVRGSLGLLTMAFTFIELHTNLLMSAAIVGFGCMLIAFVALIFLPETYGKNLDYYESI